MLSIGRGLGARLLGAVLLLFGCHDSREDDPSPENVLAQDPAEGRAPSPPAPLAPPVPAPKAGGMMFANFCQSRGARLTCAPVKLLVPPGGSGIATAHPLDAVEQSIEPAVTPPTRARMHGSAVDTANAIVYWQVGCTNTYFTTHLSTGVTRAFRLDFPSLGIPGAASGLCLNEWIFDGANGVAIAVGGTPDVNGQGKVEFAFTLTHDGKVSLLRDLRGSLAAGRRFNHVFQSIVSFDPTRREILTGGSTGDGAQQRARISLSAGSPTLVDGGFGVQAQFFDIERSRHLFWNCFLPGVSDEGSFEIKVPVGALAEGRLGSTNDVCYRGFLGAAYDPKGERFLVLLRKGAFTSTADTLSIAVVDLHEPALAGSIATDASHAMFGVDADSGFDTGQVAGNTFFFAVQYAPNP